MKTLSVKWNLSLIPRQCFFVLRLQHSLDYNTQNNFCQCIFIIMSKFLWNKIVQSVFEICVKKASEHKLDMKFIDAEYTFDDSKVIFYFSKNKLIM